MQAKNITTLIEIMQTYLDGLNEVIKLKNKFLNDLDGVLPKIVTNVQLSYNESYIILELAEKEGKYEFYRLNNLKTIVSEIKSKLSNLDSKYILEMYYHSYLLLCDIVNKFYEDIISFLNIEEGFGNLNAEVEIPVIQLWLTKLGYETSADGIMGPATQRAILNYKKDRDLPATPDIDDELIARIEREVNGIAEKGETDETGPRFPRKKTVKKTPSQSKQQVRKEMDRAAGYWLHVLDMDRENVASLKVGFKQDVLVENDVLITGDKIVGIITRNIQAVICLLVVETDTPQLNGNIMVNLRVTDVFNPPISMLLIKDIVGPIISKNPKDAFIQVSEEVYNTILQNREQPPATPKSYHATLTTEGNHTETEDKLQFENDYTSLATVMALRDVKPPLAIGLFGNWGSGKSFFMEKLITTIDGFTKNDNEAMVKNVVQVKFNSWHYSDANLWACLITEIFDELYRHSVKENKQGDLKKLSHSLQIMGLQKDDAEKKKHYLEEKVERLESERTEKRRKLQDISWIRLLKKVINDEHVKRDLDKLSNGSIDTIMRHRAEIEAHVEEAQSFGKRMSYAARTILDFKDGRWPLVLLMAAVAFFISSLFTHDLKILWDSITLETASYITLASTAITQFANKFFTATNKLSNLMTRLDSLKKTLHSEPQQEDKDLQKQKNELVEIDNSLKSLNKKIDETQRKIDDIKTGKRLLEFIESRSKDEGYTSQLGMVSWIRKDLKRLDELLREQYEANITQERKDELSKLNEAKVDFQVDRIVLYIDDLDRCKEDVVVKVLEAVHLLLAFPLFVVVVGVDPRWLNNALAKQYETMFGQKVNDKKAKDGEQAGYETANNMSAQNVATTYDYLEKIFQVPFALKPINKDGQGELIEYLLRHEMEKIDTPAPQPVPNPVPAPPKPIPNPDDPRTDPDPVPPPGPQPQPDPEPARKPVIVPEKLTFSKDELACMKRLSPIFGHTPRGINRFINVYRIIRSHNGLKINGAYDEDEYVPILFILAIIVGYSAVAKTFIDEMQLAENTELLKDVIPKMNPDAPLKDAIPACLTIKELDMQCEPFKRNLELISRFSFRTIMC